MSIRLIATVVLAALLLTGTSLTEPAQTASGGDILPAAQQSTTIDPPEAAAPAETAAPSTAATLTEEEAKAIALAHATLTTEDVTRLKAEFDRDDLIPNWEVEFRYGDWEYDYTISAVSGEILKWDKEYDPLKKTETPAEPVATEPPVTEVTTLTAEEAKAIALAHAGFTADQVTRLRAEFDRDDGVTEWEVEFRVDGWEYEYEINAETGEILHSEKEWDD